MAFVVEDGTGLTNATAFVSTAYVDSYLADRGRSTENGWQSQASSAKQAAIIAATDYIEHRFGHRYKGTRANETQALGWPRSYVYDRDGYLLDDTALPAALEKATAEYAIRALGGDLQPDPTFSDTGKAITRLRERVGPIETETQYEAGGSVSQVTRSYPAADNLLRSLLIAEGSYRA
jgi:hypothetical protein